MTLLLYLHVSSMTFSITRTNTRHKIDGLRHNVTTIMILYILLLGFLGNLADTGLTKKPLLFFPSHLFIILFFVKRLRGAVYI